MPLGSAHRCASVGVAAAAVLVAMLGAKAAACSVAGALRQDCPVDPMSVLADGEWRIVALDNDVVAPDLRLTIVFGQGQVHGHSGCNRYSGGFSVAATALAFGGIAATRRACPPHRMEVEARFHRLLGKVAGFTLAADGALELRDVSGALLISARR